MTWKIEFAAEAESDIDLLFHHLADSYVSFGESRFAAAERAVVRIDTILKEAERIASAPHRGMLHDDILPGLRHLTLDRAIYWYRVEEQSETVRILAIFYGSQDHVRRMLLRLLSDRD